MRDCTASLTGSQGGPALLTELNGFLEMVRSVS